ncbi:hypothetical protein M430DRAFT_154429 [Amorphotheca resinae ATCC 22711]|uniref:Uncharacterized protein n=1 Tax=Amorphotheca resinae ATCC 22711 TaxID=857342 RepID=A0A2T3BDI6_AMORE|nr:hypothetical protein M430DRAFT_154429 [Amorphotheca resinae ATCC 22711]PSS27461.1 hypothetical protein M430DRAFT_154429 [Amorphotheca resinae ATCC 22711]
MTSKAFSQKSFLNPEALQDESVHEEKNSRRATVYDAVAGRISAAGFIPKDLVIPSTRDTTSTSTTAVSPEAVLFRQRNAPTRYEETDIYFANERELNADLPDSDLLKALHCYASDFYSRATTDGGSGDWRSLDETALIALGILMEEATRDVLGETGDLVFTEGEIVDGPSKIPPGRSQSRAPSVASERGKERPSKKRRILDGNEATVPIG